MSEMVERVARALKDFRPRESDRVWAEDEWHRVARAAIEAMREIALEHADLGGDVPISLFDLAVK